MRKRDPREGVTTKALRRDSSREEGPAMMTAEEKALWEQAVRVLRQNTVTTNSPAAGRVPAAEAGGRVASRREGAERSLYGGYLPATPRSGA